MTTLATRMNLGTSRVADPDRLQRQRLKVDLHAQLVDALELSLLAVGNDQQLRGQVRDVADELVRTHGPKLDADGRRELCDEILDEVFGLGPLEPLFADDAVSDILVNHPWEVFVERHGRLEPTDVLFADERHLTRIIQRIVARVGRRIDESSPMVDARLPDGSRVNAVLPPLALDSPTLSIRRFGSSPLQLGDLLENGTLTNDIADFLIAAVDARLSFLIVGGTGAGKTTLLNCLTRFVADEERIVTIEDAAELVLQHRHVVRMETRPPNTEDSGEVTQRDLVRNSLRMRPDRIVVGEVRGPEALDMLQAMNTGHDGSLTTIHANDVPDALSRLEMMVGMAGHDFPLPVVRQYISSGVDLIVHVARLRGGLRRVLGVSELVGVREGEYLLNDLFSFRQKGVDEEGTAFGDFEALGHVPHCLQRIHASGVELSEALFSSASAEAVGADR